ncbi:hypothetical protein T492DRAFT_880213, partial [Pavlovales sp. CCMP2436]
MSVLIPDAVSARGKIALLGFVLTAGLVALALPLAASARARVSREGACVGHTRGGLFSPAVPTAQAMSTATLFFDGGASPNPGPGGAGALLVLPSGETLWEGSVF